MAPAATPSRVQLHEAQQSIGSRGGSGSLNGLTSSYDLPDGSFCLISSTFRPPSSPTPVPSPSSSRSRSAAASRASPNDVGIWQVRAGRIVEGHTAWFEEKWQAASLKELIYKNNCADWKRFEERVSNSWRECEISFGAPKQQTPQACKSFWVIIGLDPESQIRLKLHRVPDETALLLSTSLCAELAKDCDALRRHLDTKQAQLDHSRSLAGVAPPPPSQVSSSLVNPGRIKRKHVDDGGFEEEEEEDHDDDDDAIETEFTVKTKVAEVVAVGAAGQEKTVTATAMNDSNECEEDLLSPKVRSQNDVEGGKSRDFGAESTYTETQEMLRRDSMSSQDSETQEDILSTIGR